MNKSDVLHVKLLIDMMKKKGIATTTNSLALDKFIFFCLMNVNLKLATLKRRQDLEYDVIEIIGRLYEQVTLKMTQQT